MPGVLKDHDSGSQSPLQSYAVSETSSANGNAAKDPIAICGMACRLPGGVKNPEQLWTFLTNKQDGRSRVPESRYNTDGFSSKRSKPGATRTDYGYFIDDNLRSFDASRFHMSVKELERCDPQQRLLLQVSQECIDDAGEMGTSGRRIGVYVGDMQRGWSDVYEKETQNYGTYHLLGLDDFALANRVSYEMNLKGPRAIATGECDGAIVGGVSIIMGPTTSIQVGEQGALSPDGSCKSYSANANGYARAEGVSTIYIKPLSAALRDGNPVRAIIRAAATSHNGRAGGITASNTAAQQELIKHAYSMAGIDDIRETAFVECHGTGTPVGDPAEAEAVGSLFGGDNGIYIGSVKANLGHSEGASGLTSIIKAVLSLEHNSIPPNIKFDVPNPAISFAKYNITVPTDTMPWPEGRKKRVSINNFGIGGANSHVILDSAEVFEAGQQLEEANDHPHLLVYSAATSESLSSMGKSYAEYLNKHPERIQDVVYTLVHKRESLEHRGFLVASRDSPGTPSIPIPSPGGSKINIVMVFTGQGAQWPQMGRDLLKSNDNFRNSIQRMDLELKRIGGADLNWTIEGELKKTAKRSRVNLAEFSQPLCTAVQVSLVECFKAIGVTPSAVVGHSSGEIAGAYAAGALTLEEAITAAYHRGAVAGKQNREGAMAAIGLSWNDVKPFLIPTVGVACDNSPNSVTISGDADKVAEVIQAISLAMPDVLARLLKVDKAYHSCHMAEVGPVYFDLVDEGLGSREPRVPFFSSVEGRLLNKTEFLGAKYWQKNLESPVLFNDAVSAIAETPIGQNAMFLEIGPHSALSGPCLDSLHGRYSAYAFTDASRNLVNEGKMRFEGVANMDFKMLDISQSIQDSEFAEEQDRFDLIIAIDAVHRSNDPLAATKDARWVDLVMGTAQSWWTATRDSAAQLQRLDEKGWTDALDNAGLEVGDIIAAETGNPFHTNNLFIAKPKVVVKSTAKNELCVLTIDLSYDVTEMSARLKQRGYNVEHITLQDEPPANKDVIALCDEKSCFFSNMSAETFQLFNRFTSKLGSSGLLWVSPLSFRRATTPDYAQVVGFGRSIRAELDIDFAVCQTETEFTNDLVLDVIGYFTMRNKDGAWQASTDTTPEMKFAIYDGSVHVGRYYPFSLAEEHLTAEEDDRAVLRAGRQGRLAELQWQSYPAVEPSRNKVEITVFASGLNQVDVSLALGSAKQQEQATFGLEGAGVIHRVEDGVTGFQVGDRVAFLSEDSMSTSVIVHQKLVVKIPESTTLAEAATIPYAYSSADFALVGLGGLVGGQSVLIHGAHTHLGLAALRITQVLGAELYVTADKSTAETHGLDEERIFDARKPSFANDLIQATRGRGVDMLLNAASLAGNTGREVCRCVADCGSVIDLCSGSASDFYDILNSKGASYRVADLRRLCSAKPDVAATHLRSAMGFYLHDAVKAKSPPKVFAAKDAAEAFAHMLDHPFDSKAVVEIRNELEVARRPAARPEISVVQRERYLKLDSQGSYLLVGGFGGLGRQVAIWLAENGAGNIMFLSRSAGTELSHQKLMAELVSMGAGVQALQGSVTCMQDVRQAIQQAALPVKGIIQMSMVLRDTAWGAMTFDDWVAASEPKVRGTWNLHNASLEAGASLDLFVMFSSIAAVVGMPGQTNYAAGNTFLDAFAQYRNDLGLAASTINVGVVEDVGVARDPSLLTGFKSMDFVTVRASDVIGALSLAIKKPSPKASRTYDGSRAFVDAAAFAIGLGSTTPLSSLDSRALWGRDVRMAMYRNRKDADGGGGGGGQGGSRNDSLRTFLSSARSDKAVLEAPEAATLLAQEIGIKVLSMLGKPVDSLRTDLSLSDIGMDSLVGIEMRKWWKGTFGFEISLLEMLGMGTLELLGKHVITNLMKLFHEG
ncbi:Lovastatin nonaketide synthase mokA [Beauveria bassiana]|uniref:Lovastatin nonaketide synthase mokA n=1 Tax=Beauveria bassiana TaxID=176275 RepID=A0A2N6NX52_BEABA|nr:Lovastatin nonaketide synthase mokA [Beauveria bassiana]